MKTKQTLRLIFAVIVIASAVASACGIFMEAGNGPYQYTSIRGQEITISGKGLYQNMSADVAIQGIAQDYLTLFLAIPLLIIFGFLNNNSLKLKVFLAGLTAYFLVTYFFYLCMGMYNECFLLYVIIAGTSFFGFIMQIQELQKTNTNTWFGNKRPAFAGWFLIANAILIGAMWLSVVLPPMMDGSLYPVSLEHYTTLIVQGLDLAILLPASMVSGVLFLQRKSSGYLFTPVYLVFLSFMMLALTAKITGMGLQGVNIVPAVYIIPVTTLLALAGGWMCLGRIKTNG